MFFVILFSLLCSFSLWANPCSEVFRTSPKGGPTGGSKSSTQPQPHRPESLLKSSYQKWTPAQKLAFLAYSQARSQAQSFLHIAPFSKGNNLVMAYALMEHLIATSSKKAFVQKPPLVIVTVSQAGLIDPLAHLIEEVALKYHKIINPTVIKWSTRAKDLSLDLSPHHPSIVLMTHYKLKNLLKNPDSENYDLLSSYLSMTVLRLTPPLETDLVKALVSELKMVSSAFIYGMTVSPFNQQKDLSPVFQKNHWSYLNTTEWSATGESLPLISKDMENKDMSLFQTDPLQNPKEDLLKQWDKGVKQRELTHFQGPELIDLSKETTPPVPLFVSEQQRDVLHPHYYPLLVQKLAPVLKAHKKGIVLTPTNSSSERLTYLLSETFPKIHFRRYSHSDPYEEKQVVLKDSLEIDHYYIVASRNMSEIENMPHLSAYIDLDVNRPIVDRLILASPVLSLHEGKDKANIILLRNFDSKSKVGSKKSDPYSVTVEKIHLLNLESQEGQEGHPHQALNSPPPSIPLVDVDQTVQTQPPIPLGQVALQPSTDFQKPKRNRRTIRPQSPKPPSYRDRPSTIKRKQKIPKLPWEEALKKARSAGLSSVRAYQEWRKDHPDMPYRPDRHEPYMEHWQSWDHFLGKAKLTWEEILKKARLAQLPSRAEYQKWQKAHPEMPAAPDNRHGIYRKYWQGWDHFLGKAKLTWEEILEKARSAGLSGASAYRKWQKDHPEMPTRPDRSWVYRKYWQSWDHFLGQERLSWEEILTKARAAKLVSASAYWEWRKNHPEMPSRPDQSTVYAQYWQGWPHFLGHERLPWEEALKKARSAGLSTAREYREWQKDHPDMLSHPFRHEPYMEHWKSWDHFLGNEKLPWEEVLAKVRLAGLSTANEYREWQKAHPEMPIYPETSRFYKKNWQGWAYFLGYEKLPWEKALKKARSAKLSGVSAYWEWQKNHPNMPFNPDRYKSYAGHWQGWSHFLGHERLPWEEALTKARSAKLSTARAYHKWQKDHPDMPYNPDKYEAYAGHWQGWPHFLGKK